MLSTRLASALVIAALAAPAMAQDVSFQLVNDSGLTLMEFYTSPADEGSWGDDLLVANVLASGESGTVDISNGDQQCDRDLRFVFEDGSEMIDRVNICDTASYTLSPA
ncbi:hypothetical protein [Rubellimicrobium arenae]|uniref:hypothetical protein n=1 Tax=Rubellimicrobium arenae TaxID=2817372 RepID=UPI001B30980D|nr:hypothetical protein [Rubellimicrobium arenae]